MEITLAAKPESITIETAKSALAVVDMQNAFCKKGGMMDYLGMIDLPSIQRIIDTDKKVIEAFRAKDIRIVYLRMTYKADDDANAESPFYWKEGGLKAIRENPELKPAARDIVIDKSRFSGFTRTGLDVKLRKLKIKYLFFTGLFTNICVESTLRDAFFHEYFPILIEDACGNMGPAYTQEATVFNVTQVFGWVMNSADVVKSLGK